MLEHHGDARYTLRCATDEAHAARYLTCDASALSRRDGGDAVPLLLSGEPGAAFPALASLFSLEAMPDAAGGLGGWALRACATGTLIGFGANGRAVALPRRGGGLGSAAPMLRLVDVTAAAAHAAGGGAAAHAAAAASLAPDAPRASRWAAAGAAAGAVMSGTASVPRRGAASLQAFAAAALSREAGPSPDAPPPASLSEDAQLALYGAAYVPDDVAVMVRAAWAARQPCSKPCKTLLPAREAAFPGALRCGCCERTLLRMGAAVNPAHHGFLERAATRAPVVGPDGSVGGAFWQAAGIAACVGMALIAAANGARGVLRARRGGGEQQQAAAAAA
jgi:hypothetical protein